MLMVRGLSDATAITALVREEIHALDPDVPVNRVMPLEVQHLTNATALLDSVGRRASRQKSAPGEDEASDHPWAVTVLNISGA